MGHALGTLDNGQVISHVKRHTQDTSSGREMLDMGGKEQVGRVNNRV